MVTMNGHEYYFPHETHADSFKPYFDAERYILHDDNGQWTVHEGDDEEFETMSFTNEDDAIKEWLRVWDRHNSEWDI